MLPFPIADTLIEPEFLQEVAFPALSATPAALIDAASMLPLMLILPLLEQFFMELAEKREPATPAASLPSSALVIVMSALFLQFVSVPPS